MISHNPILAYPESSVRSLTRSIFVVKVLLESDELAELILTSRPMWVLSWWSGADRNNVSYTMYLALGLFIFHICKET